MINTDIVIVDSGVCYDRADKGIRNIHGIGISQINGQYIVEKEFEDYYGHGTAVYNIINKHSDMKEIFIIKIFEGEDAVEEEILICALKYINDNINCKIVNLSMGVKSTDNYIALKQACNELVKKGIIIVSAFDNDGSNSFPAAFENVIGVSSNYKLTDVFEYEYVEGSPVNILAKGGYQRVKWSNLSDAVLGGNSFACAFMTSYISNIISNRQLSFNEVLLELKKGAKYIYCKREYEKNTDDYFDITKAAVFPINKEMHSLIRFSDKLNFHISDLYDIKQSGRVGADCKNIVKALDDSISYVIKDIKNIDFDSIDTLIIGHMEEINRMVKYDLRLQIVLEAVQKGINVFSFDELEYCKEEIKERQSKVYYPIISMFDVPQNTFGKLYNISRPVVGVFGTSSKQGKFTLQITLKELLENDGYSVGAIGTEPHSLLLGMDYVYPLGYNSAIHVDGNSAILILNRMEYDLCRNEVDIIISGSQAGCIPLNFSNLLSIPIKQHSFLVGLQPDVIVLCVNPNDNVEHIQNAIKYLEGVTSSKVIGLVLFPLATFKDWRGIFDEKEKLGDDTLKKLSEDLSSFFQIPVYILGKQDDMSNLKEGLINYFSD